MNIYVGNLPLEMTADRLRNEFTQFGVVLSVTIMNDSYIGSGQPRAYGYVEMASKAEGTAAIASLVGKVLDDKIIEVIEALPLTSGAGAVKNVSLNRFGSRRRGERR